MKKKVVIAFNGEAPNSMMSISTDPEVDVEIVDMIGLAHPYHQGKDMFSVVQWVKKIQNKIPQLTEKIPQEELSEFEGQILEVFEDFLEEKGIVLENPEKEEAVSDGEDPESIANLYGTDYGNLQSEVEEILINWKLADQRSM